MADFVNTSYCYSMSNILARSERTALSAILPHSSGRSYAVYGPVGIAAGRFPQAA
jgi:hypothetical protein